MIIQENEKSNINNVLDQFYVKSGHRYLGDSLEIAKYQNLFEEHFKKISSRFPQNFSDITQYHFSSSGKLLRAKLILQTALSYNADVEAALNWACAVEIIHNASLIHDDICDRDTHRRQKASVPKYFGMPTALCFGDGLIASSFAVISNYPGCVTALAAGITEICDAQIAEFNVQGYPCWDVYKKIATGKTAPLLQIGVQGALDLAGESELYPSCEEFLAKIGLCYQLINDLKNFSGTDGAMSPCSDLSNVRPNAVIACFRESLKAKDALRFDCWADNIRSGKLIADTTETREWWYLVKESDAFQCVFKRAETLLASAHSDLEDLPFPLAKILCQLLIWVEQSIHSSRV